MYLLNYRCVSLQAKRLLRSSILKIEQSDTLLEDDLPMPGVAVPGAAAGDDTGGLGRQPEDAPEARIERGEDPSAENDENAPPGAVGEKRGWVPVERFGGLCVSLLPVWCRQGA